MALKPASMEPLDLDVDLTQVDTSMPVLTAGLKDLRIHDIVKAENKDKNGFNLEVTLATTVDEPTQQGETVKAGFPLKMWMPLQAKADAADAQGWKKNLAMLMDAALGCTIGNRPKFNKADLINKVVRAAVKIEDFEGRPTNKVGMLTYPE